MGSSQADTTDESGEDPQRPPGRGRAALAGALAVAVALGVTQLLAALLAGGRSFVIALGDVVIDSVPGAVERAVISVLGTADKPFLIVMVVLTATVLGAAVGVLGRRRPAPAAAALAVMTGLGAAACLADPRAQTLATIAIWIAGAVAGILTLLGLLRAAARSAPAASTGATAGRDVDRRQFLKVAAVAAAVAGVGAAGGRLLAGSERVERLRQAIRLPRPARPAPPPPPGADLKIHGLSPLYVPNEDFYRIDTALRVPRVDPETWSLEITGRVDRPYRISYAELMALPHIEADVTLACVSNEVGADLVGNARWQGVPLSALLERAGLREDATQVLSRSVDGFTAGFPTVTALDVDEAMVAVGMNGEPLPASHGFPARLVVPGLYGYVSATKWLSSIELTGWDVDGYWIPRGWAKEGPIKTQSRIDVPAPDSTVPAGRRPIAGVAWAPTRGIQRVEVRVDDGPWREATLAARLDVDCWRQWFLPWDATSGEHVIAVRATDGRGEVQTDERTPVAPDGASGRHTIRVDVA